MLARLPLRQAPRRGWSCSASGAPAARHSVTVDELFIHGRAHWPIMRSRPRSHCHIFNVTAMERASPPVQQPALAVTLLARSQFAVKATLVACWCVALLAFTYFVGVLTVNGADTWDTQAMEIFVVASATVVLFAAAKDAPVTFVLRWTSLVLLTFGGLLSHALKRFLRHSHADGTDRYLAYHAAADTVYTAGCVGYAAYVLVRFVAKAYPLSPLVRRATAAYASMPRKTRAPLFFLAAISLVYYVLTNLVTDLCGDFSVYFPTAEEDPSCVLRQAMLDGTAFCGVMLMIGALLRLRGASKSFYDACTTGLSTGIAVFIPSYIRSAMEPDFVPPGNMIFACVLYIVSALTMASIFGMYLWNRLRRPPIDMALASDEEKLERYLSQVSDYYTREDVLEALREHRNDRTAALQTDCQQQ
jgi:hypothetical protein